MTEVAEIIDLGPRVLATQTSKSSNPVNNYVRVFDQEPCYFDDTDEMQCRRVFKNAYKLTKSGTDVTLYRMLPFGWVSYTGGCKVVLVCPEDRHEWRRDGDKVFCLHCCTSDVDTEMDDA